MRLRTRCPLPPRFAATALTLLALLAASPAGALSISGVQSLADLQALNDGASYGPPPAARFAEPGPVEVPSGSPADVFAGPPPGLAAADSILLTVAIEPDDLVALGSITVAVAGDGSVTLTAADFFTREEAGFPDLIPGIGNGASPGVRFPGALVAGILLDAPELATASTEDLLGTLTVDTPVLARLDLFGVADGAIVNNTSNSAAAGITVPEPGAAAAVLLALGAWARRARRARR